MNTNKSLGERIENLVGELVEAHMNEMRTTVLAAVTRGFGAPETPVKQARAAKKKRSFNRRSPEEVSVLAERLYELVCTKPGEPMVTFATELGASARELHRPMMTLRDAGRVRSVGERSRTCYFPAVGGESSRSRSA